MNITRLAVAGRVVKAWGRILQGYNPVLSIEITRECPLTCPGCYAYNPEHLGGGITLRQVSDKRGKDLVDGVLGLISKYKPVHVSLIGGEPLVRVRELDEILPQMSAQGIHTQLVTSAVRSIPKTWATIPNLQICVSIDGLQPEHDERRKPATYERILKNIDGHLVTIHCTVTRQQLIRESYLEEFIQFWSSQPAVDKIWMSLYTPQKDENSIEKLTIEDRKFVVQKLLELRMQYAKLDMPPDLLENYLQPPTNPDECVFAKSTTCISADLERKITPCQFGGNPDCENCGCMASAGLISISRFKLVPGITAGNVFDYSQKIGSYLSRVR
jgi:MoaA/NifB/PqqE/SkfB family radical SAM enzyme